MTLAREAGVRPVQAYRPAAPVTRQRVTRPRPRVTPPSSALLPQPPSSKEKYSYVSRDLLVLSMFSLLSFGCLAITQYRLATYRTWVWIFVPFMIFTILYYVVSYSVNLFTKGFDLKAHKNLVRTWEPARYPSVDVFLPVCGEPIEVLHNTWTHVRNLAIFYPGTVTPYVLDDSDSQDLRAMAADFGFRYGVRPNRGWFKKAGNMQFGFKHSTGDFILILDADFTPRHDMLNEILPYMQQDPKLGIVQTPQFFRVLNEQNWIERGAGAVQEYFYRLVQVSRDRYDGAICVGTCALYRRAALAENGGTTLIEHSEDVHTGFDLRRLGWSLKYIPISLAAGVCPDNVSAFYNQQYRWCMGSMSLLKSKKFWSIEMRPLARLAFFSGFLYYSHTAVFSVVGPLVPVVMLLVAPELFHAEHMAWLVPGLVFSTVIFPMWHRAPYRLEAWSIRVLYGWAHFFVFVDLARGRQMGWKPTGASGAKKSKIRRLMNALWGWSLTTALAWVVLAIWRMFTYEPSDFAVVAGIGIFNLIVVGRAMIMPREDEAG